MHLQANSKLSSTHPHWQSDTHTNTQICILLHSHSAKYLHTHNVTPFSIVKKKKKVHGCALRILITMFMSESGTRFMQVPNTEMFYALFFLSLNILVLYFACLFIHLFIFWVVGVTFILTLCLKIVHMRTFFTATWWLNYNPLIKYYSYIFADNAQKSLYILIKFSDIYIYIKK